MQEERVGRWRFNVYAHKRLLIGFAASALLLVVALLIAPFPSRGIQQPIRFNHQIHTKKEPCTRCHIHVATRRVAGRPQLSICMECHANPVTKSPEEEKLRQLARENGQLAWVRLTRLPRHVRFSHQRHVAVGKVECRVCHGAIAERTEPPQRPLVQIEMSLCLSCHRAEGVRIAAPALKAFREAELAPPLLETLSAMRNKRFDSRRALLAYVESRGAISDEQRNLIASQTEVASAVSTDCIACHR